MKVKKEYRFIITRVIVALAVLMIDKIKQTSCRHNRGNMKRRIYINRTLLKTTLIMQLSYKTHQNT